MILVVIVVGVFAFTGGLFLAWSIIRSRLAATSSMLSAAKQQVSEYQEELGRLRESLNTELERRTAAEVKLSETEHRFQEFRQAIEESKRQLTDTFKALSSEALKNNNETFMTLAQHSFAKAVAQAKGEFGEKEEAIKGIVQPLTSILQEYNDQVKKLEKNRAEEYGKLTQEVSSLLNLEGEVRRQTDKLVSALKQPQTRGRWGELTLKRVVELAGMSEYCDFLEQATLNSDEGRLQPDMLIRLPAGRHVVVDAKTPLDAYLDAIDQSDDEKQNSDLRRHASHLRNHMIQLSQKAYWAQLPVSPEFVVMFIPGESFFSAAVQIDKTLIEEGMSNRVVLATPTTLVALLKAVAYGWRHEQLSRNAQKISELGKETYKRFSTLLEHIDSLRSHLGGSVSSFNAMVGSLERRIMPGLRKLREFGAGDTDLPVIEPIDQSPRNLLADTSGGERTLEEANSLQKETRG